MKNHEAHKSAHKLWRRIVKVWDEWTSGWVQIKANECFYEISLNLAFPFKSQQNRRRRRKKNDENRWRNKITALWKGMRTNERRNGRKDDGKAIMEEKNEGAVWEKEKEIEIVENNAMHWNRSRRTRHTKQERATTRCLCERKRKKINSFRE